MEQARRNYEIHIPRGRAPSRFFMGIGPILDPPVSLIGEATMMRELTRLELLANRLRQAPSADPEIFASLTAGCARFAALRDAGKANQFDRLLADAAWTDAALTLLAMELPGWTLRRLVYEDGEWICSLSQEVSLPADFDDTADFNHSDLPLAILGALLAAQARANAFQPRAKSVPEVKAQRNYAQCCDNFA